MTARDPRPLSAFGGVSFAKDAFAELYHCYTRVEVEQGSPGSSVAGTLQGVWKIPVYGSQNGIEAFSLGRVPARSELSAPGVRFRTRVSVADRASAFSGRGAGDGLSDHPAGPNPHRVCRAARAQTDRRARKVVPRLPRRIREPVETPVSMIRVRVVETQYIASLLKGSRPFSKKSCTLVC